MCAPAWARWIPAELERWALTAVAVTFFVLMYADERATNSAEDRMEYLISHDYAPLPHGRGSRESV